MLKTNIDNIAKPSNAMIIIGVLKGYIHHPILFFLKAILTFRNFKKTIKIDLPTEFINSSGLIAWLYIRLKKEIGKEKAYEIIRATILCSGLAIQQANFRNVEVERTFENLVKYQKRVKNEGTTKLNKMEIIEQTSNRYVYKVTKCMFYELFKYLEVPELTRIMCSIDNAIFNSYLPEKIIFHRNGINNRMVDGASECMFIMEKHE
ncbi:L-2-amino-thiazoline-4-carboxylic acid hydrolase [Crassaminicella profunda]|uniref:L-2-amino-thiazoline-4-carboxylic acid hydrolase n=1 Tax=Crassaminicella profunda TaxID=1286698 RepID=UPI001CA66EAC|nr:L-2-amino-thiazoline-4-carboxylic acid hydrolase [Crassaminicella profunda]QZY56129.1 L-2-amino-thiazoline-4-carboxylic acid hydrolase [Crassaminicella profunda]